MQIRWSAAGRNLCKPLLKMKELLFHPHLSKGVLSDRHTNRVVHDGLPGYEAILKPVAGEKGTCHAPVPYGFRSFDRQWIIPDNRVINRPNPELWELRSNRQIYLTAFTEESPTNGPALTFTGLVPDLDHYKGSFGGRVFPLWRDKKSIQPNMPPKLLKFLSERYGATVSAEDLVAYIAAIAAHPAFTARFQDDLSTPGLRIPITADPKLFSEAVELGKTVIWLHTFGERMADPKKGRPAQPPRLPSAKAPGIPAAGEISEDPKAMPDLINYDASKKRLLIGQGYVERVEPEMWHYEVSGKQVLLQWFSYRRERPRAPNHRRPASTFAARRHPTGPLASGIYNRTSQRAQCTRQAGRTGTSASKLVGERLFRAYHFGRGITRSGST